MNRTAKSHFLTGVLAGVAALIAFIPAAPALAQSITITGVPCAGTWQWNPPTLSCVTSTTTLACNPTPSSQNLLLNAQATINAGCTGATTWAWTKVSGDATCPETTGSSSSVVIAGPASAATACVYKVDVTDGGTKTGSGTATVSWTAAPQLSNCRFTSNPAATAGNPFNLTVVCDNGPPASPTIAWSATPTNCTGACTATFGSGPSTTGLSNTVTLPSTGSWSVSAAVTASNGSGTAVWTGTVGSASASYDCGPTYGKTLNLKLPPWTVGAAANQHLYTADKGSLRPNDAVVVEFTAPQTLVAESYGSWGWSDVGGDPPAGRLVVLSDVACDFTRGLDAKKLSIVNAAASSLIFLTGPTTKYGSYPNLTVPGKKYFLNIRNTNCTSTTGHCDLDIEFRNPK
jgi:hypothetical protein